MMKQARNTTAQRGTYITGIIFLIFSLAMVLVLRQYFSRSFDIRSRAGEKTAQKTSMRLREMESPLDVGIFVNTAGFPTAQADAAVSYDPGVLSIDDADIELLPEYKVINIDRPKPGVVFISLFITDSTDPDLFTSSTDVPVAVLHFRPLAQGIDTPISLLFDPKDPVSSGLYPARGDARGVVNILSDVYGVSVSPR